MRVYIYEQLSIYDEMAKHSKQNVSNVDDWRSKWARVNKLWCDFFRDTRGKEFWEK